MRRLSPLVFVFLIGCNAPGLLKPGEQAGTAPKTWVQVKDSRIKESSGLAESPSEGGVFYTHNDSGDKPRLFRFSPDGGKIDAIRIDTVKNHDWEDLAAATIEDRPYLYIGDIGDNLGRRNSIVVYRVPEPSKEEPTARPDHIYTLRYPDEPHNAETLMVHPVKGDLYIVTKAATRPSMVFKLPRPDGTGEYTLTKIGEVNVGGDLRESRLITGGAIAPDGDRVILRTYMAAYEFDASGAFDSWVDAKPETIPTNFDGQGEAITYLHNGKTVVTTSEGSPMQVSKIR